MPEVLVQNALGKLKKVISLKPLQKRSGKVYADPKKFINPQAVDQEKKSW